MPRLLALLPLLLLAQACSLSSASDSDENGALVLVNQTGEPLFVTALERSLADRTDPMPAFDLKTVPFPRLAPGATVRLVPPRYEEGADVAVFVYAVREVEGQAQAVFMGVRLVSAAQLRSDGGRVELADL